ncbi:MAG TPA: 3-dehydroquinate synthase family protein, partial [Macellibacteroides fermentans]|nr:3-dehydroquinate synthase family protein [Macellibacteroides fermentans]
MAAQNVIICKNLQSELQNFLQSVKYDKLFVLTDSNTLELCLPMLKEVPQLQGAPVITVEAGDTNKNIEQVTAIWMRLCNEGASRNSLLLNVGGGMITDMGGFVAATFKRGIHSVNVPTTLMASVDAAVGGKTGINFNGLKNEIGSFYPPLCVLIDSSFLKTLDRDNLLSGYAEMVKHALISNMETYHAILSFDLDRVDYTLLNQM